MQVKDIVMEDFCNYKKPSMFILFPKCTFKCEIECGKKICQNSPLVKAPTVDIELCKLVRRYMADPITEAVVCGGLEPFDSYDDLVELVDAFRKYTDDDIVIYTGYTEPEIYQELEALRQYKNIIIKFGRFIPDVVSRFDETLGIELASENQYAERIS